MYNIDRTLASFSFKLTIVNMSCEKVSKCAQKANYDHMEVVSKDFSVRALLVYGKLGLSGVVRVSGHGSLSNRVVVPLRQKLPIAPPYEHNCAYWRFLALFSPRTQSMDSSLLHPGVPAHWATKKRGDILPHSGVQEVLCGTCWGTNKVIAKANHGRYFR